ncbi:MAG TPA: glycosyltransferase family 4 protein [Opitutaceae bacterium]|nr:glycosyltransferase family 4 protein [Opitutaceae bacterium]
MNPIDAVLISTNDVRGGAAKCAARLHDALPGVGVRSRLLVANRARSEPDILEYNPVAPAPRALGRLVFRLARRLYRPSVRRTGGFFSFDRAPIGRRLLGQLPPCDLVNLHFVADLFDPRLLPHLAEAVPVVWTLHDMNPFTGGCHYSDGCERYTAGCGSCPQLRLSDGPRDLTHRCLARKRSALERVSAERFAVVASSRWMAAAAGRSSLLGRFDVHHIPSGVDTEDFRPMPRDQARRRFGLPEDARIALFVAEVVSDRRKGLQLLPAAAEAAADLPGTLFVTIGQGAAGENFRHLGSLRDTESLRAAYSAADVFVLPSLEDNFPNTMIEAMACGTPVVGFATGGIPDAVHDGATGLLAPTGDGAALAAQVRRVLAHQGLRRSLGCEARYLVEQEYNIHLHARRYATLYEQMLGEQAAVGRKKEARGALAA